MKKGLYSVIYMFIVTLCFTSVVSGVRLLNEEKILTNIEARRQSVILDVLKIKVGAGAGPEEIVRVFAKNVKPLRLNEDTIYICYDDDGLSVKGYAFSVTGPGFWGPISSMVGIDKEYSRIIGINFFDNVETPGLGARITEDWFQAQFTGLPLERKDGRGRFFTLKQAGTRKTLKELDAVTGATQTSEAVDKLLNKELNRFVQEVVPLIRKEI